MEHLETKDNPLPKCMIETLTVTTKQGQQLWDIRDVKKGVYLYTLKTGAISKNGKLIIQ